MNKMMMYNKDLVNRMIKMVGYFVIALFFVFAAYLVFSDYFTYLPINFRIIFAVLMVSYAFFRLVASINNSKNKNNENDNEE